jgi:glycosyltransferase involved in cell wall biosynthesis
LEKTLLAWRDVAPIVTTVHNFHPHGRDTPIFRELYQLVYKHSLALIHLGDASRAWVAANYALPDALIHRVIPHAAYTSFDDTVTPTAARTALNLGSEDFVCLVFGTLRDPNELHLLLEGFRRFERPKKKLIIAGRITWPSRRHAPFRYISSRLRVMFGPDIRRGPQFIPNRDVQLYLKSSDVVVIPRLASLNSGNVPLAFGFGRVTVGPDCGVIGEILRKSANPVYSPGNAEDLARALGVAASLCDAGHGEANAMLARSQWSQASVAAHHATLYSELLRNGRATT